MFTKAEKVRVGQRININACWCINPSMVDYRARRVPMVCDIRWIRKLGTSVLIESIDHKVYELPSQYCVDVLPPKGAKPPALALPEAGEIYAGVSID